MGLERRAGRCDRGTPDRPRRCARRGACRSASDDQALDLFERAPSARSRDELSAAPRSNISVASATCQPCPFLTERGVRGHRRAVEQHLVEAALAGHLHQRLHRHAGHVHREQEVREPGVLVRVGVGAREQDHPLGEVSQGRPHLVARDLPAAALRLHRAGGEAREIAARARLAEALAPDLVGAQQRREQPLLLRLGAECSGSWAQPRSARGS